MEKQQLRPTGRHSKATAKTEVHVLALSACHSVTVVIWEGWGRGDVWGVCVCVCVITQSLVLFVPIPCCQYGLSVCDEPDS